MSNKPKFTWTVEFTVDPCWVEDGFDLTDSEALDMLSKRLPYADIGRELHVEVTKRPSTAAMSRVSKRSNHEIHMRRVKENLE